MPWGLIAAVGIILTVIGSTDLALLWYPLNFGNPQWEFGTISAHLNGMPLATAGFGLLAVGIVGLGRRRTSRVLAWVSALVALSLLALVVIYLLDIPVMLKGAPPGVKSALKKAILKGGVFAAAYLAFYSWLAWFLLKNVRKGQSGSRADPADDAPAAG